MKCFGDSMKISFRHVSNFHFYSARTETKYFNKHIAGIKTSVSNQRYIVVSTSNIFYMKMANKKGM